MALALTVWSMLHRRWARLPVRLWVWGALLMGLGGIAFAARGRVPDVVSYPLAIGLMLAGSLLRTGALRVDLVWPLRWRLGAGLWGLCMGAYALSLFGWGESASAPLTLAMLMATTVGLATHAALLGRRHHSRSGLLLAATEGLFSLTLLIRLVAMAAGWTPARGIGAGWDFALLVLAGLAAALYGNLGYLGLVLDRTHAATRQAQDAQALDAAQRQAAEQATARLRGLLAQRDELATERQRLLHLLAHGLREPLHQANSALMSAADALAPATGAPDARPLTAPPLTNQQATQAAARAQAEAQVNERLRRAQAVMGDVQSVLDNTLAAASLLNASDALAGEPTSLHDLVRQTLGDLAQTGRAQVAVQWLTQRQHARLVPALARLALRNLLQNALRHGGPTVQVCLQLADQPDPPALLLQVLDNGPGLPESARQALASDGPAGTSPTPDDAGQGLALGLRFVRRVMQRHGGELRLAARAPQGLAACLVFPQPATAEPAAPAP